MTINDGGKLTAIDDAGDFSFIVFVEFKKNAIIFQTWNAGNKRAKSYESLVCENSEDADLVIMGFSLNKVTQEKGEFFKRFKNIKEILFVRAGQKIVISEG